MDDDDRRPVAGEIIDFGTGRQLRKPPPYSDALAEEIMMTYATSSKALATLCRINYHWPNFQTLYKWRLQYPIFDQAMWLAQKMRAQTWVEEAVEIVDDESKDLINGEPNPVSVARSKIRAEFRMKGARMLDPETFGERVDTRNSATYLPQDDAIKLLK